MKHKTLSKEIRDTVYRKYNGHCAYCGCEIQYDEMEVDHLKSIYATSKENDWMITQDDSLDNLMPSCQKCNFYKKAADLETFRNKIKMTLSRTCTETFQTKLAIRYGILRYKEWNGKFYFETLNEKQELTDGLYLCQVEAKFTKYMLLKYSEGEWWQYMPKNIINNVEGWIGVDFKFKPIKQLTKEEK